MVRLEPLSEAETAWFIEWAIADYARAQVTAGTWPEENAPQMARHVVESLLPEGNATPGHHLSAIVDERIGMHVGYLWYGPRESGEGRYMMVYDFVIREEHRRRGYGTAAMQVLEEETRAAGLERIMLHVFGGNHAARALYEKVGYVERDVTMVRQLEQDGEPGL
jgi:RimJ/RimL family protein N-acetyltransferase